MAHRIVQWRGDGSMAMSDHTDAVTAAATPLSPAPLQPPEPMTRPPTRHANPLGAQGRMAAVDVVWTMDGDAVSSVALHAAPRFVGSSPSVAGPSSRLGASQRGLTAVTQRRLAMVEVRLRGSTA